ncbi:MAG: adenylyltransferase/cytidyltransferase family protein [Shewanella sp.]|uniref:adenylyltransferase/cytidyltransferase family protein n=1 Tax=Shewanella sp. TaxID=50422 RepID=UPI0030014A52
MMPTKPNRTIATYGSFDMFHIGHLRLLQRAKALGNRLIVFVSTDEFNLTKGKQSLFPYEHRAEIILSSKYVDEVYPEQNWEQKVMILKNTK